MAYSTYRARLASLKTSPESVEKEWEIWSEVVAENIFVICKTPMAKSITRRTLLGFRKGKTNMWAPKDLINKIKNQAELFIKKVGDLVGKNVKIKAIVGNPPYQVMDGGAGVAVPYYHGLTLVGYAECDTFSRIYPGFGEAIGNRPPAELPDLHGIVLHHTRTRIMLCERLLGYGEDRSLP